MCSKHVLSNYMAISILTSMVITATGCGDVMEANEPIASPNVKADIAATNTTDSCSIALQTDAVTTSVLTTAQQAFNQDCNRTGTWCELRVLSAYKVTHCSGDLETRIQQLVESVEQLEPNWRSSPLLSELGNYLKRSELDQSTWFNTTYSAGGPDLLDALDKKFGSPVSFLNKISAGWMWTAPRLCRNCHEFDHYTLLYYPLTQHVVLLTGIYNYDS